MLIRVRTYFAVRKKGTKLYLPESKGAYTWSEPVDAGTSKLPVRLFPTKKAAGVALAMWAKGSMHASKKYNYGKDGDETFEIMVEEPLSGPRNKDDYEVVPLVLSVHVDS